MNTRLPLTFILMLLLLDAMGIGLILQVIPDLLLEVTGQNGAQAALWGSVLTAVFVAMRFLVGPILGGLSDRYGRRTVLLLSLAVMTLEYGVMALADSAWWLVAAPGLGVVASASYATAAACVADLSAPDKKAVNFGLIGAALALGFTLGPLVGVAGAESGIRVPFWVAAGLAAAILAVGFFVLPETLQRKDRRPFEWKRAHAFGALRAATRLPGLKTPLLIHTLCEFAQVAYPAVWAYFAAERFGWSADKISLCLVVLGISCVFMQGFFIRLILPVLGDRGTVIFGLAANLAVFLLFAFIEDGTLALWLTPLTALGACVAPTLQGIMSRATPANAQGELQGLLESLRSLTSEAGPIVFTSLFFAFTTSSGALYLPGAPFLVSASIMAGCAVLLWVMRKKHHNLPV